MCGEMSTGTVTVSISIVVVVVVAVVVVVVLLWFVFNINVQVASGIHTDAMQSAKVPRQMWQMCSAVQFGGGWIFLLSIPRRHNGEYAYNDALSQCV